MYTRLSLVAGGAVAATESVLGAAIRARDHQRAARR
jgi:hypothetical protein